MHSTIQRLAFVTSFLICIDAMIYTCKLCFQMHCKGFNLALNFKKLSKWESAPLPLPHPLGQPASQAKVTLCFVLEYQLINLY